jgi:hypothetical protein
MFRPGGSALSILSAWAAGLGGAGDLDVDAGAAGLAKAAAEDTERASGAENTETTPSSLVAAGRW